MYDLAIIGLGPAGISCAITAKQRNLNVIILGQSINTNPLWKTTITNYPGFEKIEGKDLLNRLQDQVINAEIEIKKGLVRQVIKDENFMILQGDNIIEAKSVAICVGISRPKSLDGEDELLGDGISYCATCDAMFYKNKNIAVLSEFEGGVEEANFLNNVVGSVEYFPLKKHDYSELDKKIKVKEIKVSNISKNNNQLLINQEHNYDGVFIFRSSVSISSLIENLEMKNNYIVVDRQMKTNIDGLFAAGDCTGLPLQLPKAVGEGNIAALSIASYLRNKK